MSCEHAKVEEIIDVHRNREMGTISSRCFDFVKRPSTCVSATVWHFFLLTILVHYPFFNIGRQIFLLTQAVLLFLFLHQCIFFKIFLYSPPASPAATSSTNNFALRFLSFFSSLEQTPTSLGFLPPLLYCCSRLQHHLQTS